MGYDIRSVTNVEVAIFAGRSILSTSFYLRIFVNYIYLFIY
jgi:hypothetical protein